MPDASGLGILNRLCNIPISCLLGSSSARTAGDARMTRRGPRSGRATQEEIGCGPFLVYVITVMVTTILLVNTLISQGSRSRIVPVRSVCAKRSSNCSRNAFAVR